jgi:hypothetical protein
LSLGTYIRITVSLTIVKSPLLFPSVGRTVLFLLLPVPSSSKSLIFISTILNGGGLGGGVESLSDCDAYSKCGSSFIPLRPSTVNQLVVRGGENSSPVLTLGRSRSFNPQSGLLMLDKRDGKVRKGSGGRFPEEAILKEWDKNRSV